MSSSPNGKEDRFKLAFSSHFSRIIGFSLFDANQSVSHFEIEYVYK